MEIKMKRRLFLFEKISQIKSFFNNGFFKKNDIAIIAPSYLSYSFTYKGTTKTINNKIKYKRNNESYGNNNKFYTFTDEINMRESFLLSKLLKDNNDSSRLNALKKIKEFVNQFHEIVYMTDNDYTGARAFNFKLEKFLGIDIKENKDKIYHVSLCSYAKKEVKKSLQLKTKILESNIYLYHTKCYLKKDFFDYNFNVNSNKYYTQYLKKKGVDLKTPLSRNCIQILLKLKKTNMKSSDLLDYCVNNNISNCGTISIVLNHLIHNKLIEENKSVYQLSFLGKTFLNENIESLNYYNLSNKLIRNMQDVFYDMDLFKRKYNKIIKNIFKENK
jgi:hypothetical protein